MIRNIDSGQLVHLLEAVFGFRGDERALTIFVDLPGGRVKDTAAWMDRRRLATEWYLMLHDQWHTIPFTALAFCAYPNVGTNNGDLPDTALLVERVGVPRGPALGEVMRRLRDRILSEELQWDGTAEEYARAARDEDPRGDSAGTE